MADKETAGRTIEGEDVVVSSSLLTSPIEGWERPGFSLGMDEWFAEDFPPPKKKGCLSLSCHTSSPLQDSTNRLGKPGATSTIRFAKPIEASVFSDAAKGVIPLKTEQTTRWAVNNFECCARCLIFWGKQLLVTVQMKSFSIHSFLCWAQLRSQGCSRAA